MVPSDGVFGPEVRVAWVGRLEILDYSARLITVSGRVAQLSRLDGGNR